MIFPDDQLFLPIIDLPYTRTLFPSTRRDRSAPLRAPVPIPSIPRTVRRGRR